MTRSVELATLDLRYESYRMRNPAAEARLLASIAERGIEEALEGVDAAGTSILLNGFKRYRCAAKLRLQMAPYASLGEDEAAAIVALLRVSNDHSLTILEQARFLEELRERNAMSVADIAGRLSRSKSWVSMWLGLMAEMSAVVREKLFSGGFPVYPYMYALRQFIRMNGVQKQDIEDFVVALAGKKLSVREIEQLARGYFRGPGLVPRGHPARPRGPGFGLVSAGARDPGRLQRVRTRAAEGSGDRAEAHAAGDGEEPGPALADVRVFRAGTSANGRNPEPGTSLLRGDEKSCMIDADKRQAVLLLHQEGMERNQIARQLRISPNTVDVIIRQKGQRPVHTRQDKIQVDPDLLKRLYQECDGYAQRVHEKLVEDEHFQIQYSTLTRLLRELGLSRSQEPRCDRVPDSPGAEMQHDTTRYAILLGGARVMLVASLLYLRYSKATVLALLSDVPALPHEMLLARGADVLGNMRRPFALLTTPIWRACAERVRTR